MDDTDLLKMAGVSSSGLAVIFLLYRVWKMIRGRRLISTCCGRRLEIGIDTQSMSPRVAPAPVPPVLPLSSSSSG